MANERALTSGEQFVLGKEGVLEFGFGWDEGCDSPDIDVSVTAVDRDGEIIGSCYFGNQSALVDYGITTSGDNQTGAGDGDDETIYVDLTKLSSAVKIRTLYFTLSAYSAFCHSFVCTVGKKIRLYGPYNGDVMQIGHFNLSAWSSATCGQHIVAGALHRTENGEFEFHGVDQSIMKYDGCRCPPPSVNDILPDLSRMAKLKAPEEQEMARA